MSEEKTYLASDLVNELGVARSTINDWLTRYADYLESEARGKRRVYTARSLEVLRQIAELRNNNASSFEIEQRLTQMFGVHPEVATPVENNGENAANEENSENLPMARPMFDEMNNRIAGEFVQLAEKLGQFETERRSFSRRLWRMFALIFFLFSLAIILLIFCACYLYGELGKQQARTSAEITQNNQKYELLQKESELRHRKAEEESKKQMDQFSVVLDKNRADFRKNLDKLSGELAQQRKEYSQQLKKMESDAAAKTELELRKAKEEFAKQQLEKLQELSRRQKNIDTLKQEKNRQEEEIAALKKRLAELEEQLKKASAPATPPVPATPPAPPANQGEKK